MSLPLLRIALAAVPVSACQLAFPFSEQSDGGATRDAGTVDCGIFSLPPASSFSDDFSGATPSMQWVVTQPPCATQAGGAVVAQAPSNPAGYCQFVTRNNYHLACDSISVKVPRVTNPLLGAQTIFLLTDWSGGGAGRQASIILENGGFEFGGTTGGTMGLNTYDANEDLWWQLRESGGQFIFDTSPDGTNWTERGRTPDPFSFDQVAVTIGAGEYRSVPDGGEAEFRCYNKPPPCQ